MLSLLGAEERQQLEAALRACIGALTCETRVAPIDWPADPGFPGYRG